MVKPGDLVTVWIGYTGHRNELSIWMMEEHLPSEFSRFNITKERALVIASDGRCHVVILAINKVIDFCTTHEEFRRLGDDR